jgi:hypothetical protein
MKWVIVFLAIVFTSWVFFLNEHKEDRVAGPISQSESDVIAQRVQNIARQMLDMAEEMARLRSLNSSLDLSTNLDAPSSGIVTKQEILDFVTGPMADYEDFFDNLTVLFDTTSGGNERRAKIDPFLVTENV